MRSRLSPFPATALFLFLLAHWSDAFPVGRVAAVSAPRRSSHQQDDTFPRLSLLSEQPLLLVTDEIPLLSATECRILRDGYRRGKTGAGTDHQHVLQSLQERLDCLLLRDKNDEIVEPRFLDYPSDDTTYASLGNEAEQLLPDGLHVDTNNAYYLRYLTVLVYLSTSDRYRATTFPVIQPDVSTAWCAAHELLLEHNQHHTRRNLEETEAAQAPVAAQTLEQAAVELFTNSHSSPAPDGVIQKGRGLRVLPRTGHAVIFSSLTPDGHPDPRTWHGAENVFNDPKQALSLFYECPLERVYCRQDLGAYAQERYQKLLAGTRTRKGSGTGTMVVQ